MVFTLNKVYIKYPISFIDYSKIKLILEAYDLLVPDFIEDPVLKFFVITSDNTVSNFYTILEERFLDLGFKEITVEDIFKL